jgi:hypothetical protein
MATVSAAKSKARKPFVWGTRTVKTKKPDGTLDTRQVLSLGSATKAAIDALNLVEPTKEQKTGNGKRGEY